MLVFYPYLLDLVHILISMNLVLFFYFLDL